MEGILVPISIMLGMFALIFGIVYLFRRERMALIERGMDPRRYAPQSAPYQNLKWGLLLIGAGLGLFIAYVLDQSVFTKTTGHNPAIYFSLIAVFGGTGLFISYLIEKREVSNQKQMPAAEEEKVYL